MAPIFPHFLPQIIGVVGMRRLSERMNIARSILRELGQQPLTHSELEMRTIHRAYFHFQFESILKYLAQSGFIKKEKTKLCSNYAITDKGSKLLEAIA
jgi:predicted transcriptional regulator